MTGERTQSVIASLIAEFGDFRRIIAASAAQIEAVVDDPGPIASVLAHIHAATDHCLRIDLQAKAVAVAGSEIIAFLKHRLATEPVEVIYALYFDASGKLIHDGEAARGTFLQCTHRPKEIARKALLVGAASVVIAHNHPSGDPSPSAADKRLTHDISRACQLVDAELFDHIIVGRPEVTSFRASGML